MIKPNRKSYDLIVSLGGNCSAASQIKFRGLRTCSLALDWVAMFGEKPLLYLPDGLRTRFRDFCKYENMQEFDEPRMEHGRLTYKFKDTATGFHFWHHFFAPLADREAFDRARLVLDRRLKRFYDKVAGSKNVLFVLSTPFSYDPHLAEGVVSALRDVFPDTTSELVLIQFAAPSHELVDLCDGALHAETFTRAINVVYDNSLTSTEWAWMDGLSLSGSARPPSNFLRRCITRWKYKLWKKLGKSLLKDGVAQDRMTFCQIERGVLFAEPHLDMPGRKS
jgi:hypothetical protein